MKTAFVGKELERRSDSRRQASEPIWWRTGGSEGRLGWLLEQSPRGGAFIGLGSGAPKVAEPLEIHRWSAERGDWITVYGYVRRVQRVHGDMFLVGMFQVVDRPRMALRAEVPVRRLEPAVSLRPNADTRLVAA